MYAHIDNLKELQEENGLYYPFIMQILGAPVIAGKLIPTTDLKYLYDNYIEGVFQILANSYIVNKNNEDDHSHKLFKKISIQEFKTSTINALADLFYGGCEPENFDEDKTFEFLNKEEHIRKNPDDIFSREYITRKKYASILIP